ncbi:MAG: hypothetical protein ACR2F1_01475 [Nitrososphaeraceae archaeon]
MTNKVAVISLTDPSDHARMLHVFEYVLDLKNNGINAELFLDGSSVKIVDFLEKNPKDPIKQLYDKVIQEGYLKEACHFCVSAFSVKQQITNSNITLSPENKHISIGRLVKERYQIIIV